MQHDLTFGMAVINAFDAEHQPHVIHSDWQRQVHYPCISGFLSQTITGESQSVCSLHMFWGDDAEIMA